MPAPIKLTEKRPLYRGGFDVCGLTVSVSATQNQRLVAGPDEELSFVSGGGVQGVETTLWRKQLSARTALKLNGPALGYDQETNSLSSRILGVGASHERLAQDGVNNIQVSGEVRVTPKTLAAVAGLAGPAALASAHAMFAPTDTMTQAFHHSMQALLPAVSTALAVRSLANVVDEFERPRSTWGDKALAMGRAVGDMVRIFDVGVGTVISTGVAVASAFVGWWRLRKALKNAAES